MALQRAWPVHSDWSTRTFMAQPPVDGVHSSGTDCKEVTNIPTRSPKSASGAMA